MTATAGAPSADLLPPELLEELGGLEIVARHVVRGFVSGMHRSPFLGAGEEFTRHRAYQQGDEVRHIDWRLYGRTDRLYVKEFREDSNLQALILVDASASMGYGQEPSKLRYATYLAGCLAHLMLRSGDAVGLAACTGGGTRFLLPARNRRGQLHEMLLALEGLRAEGAVDLATALDEVGGALRRQGRVLVVSDFLDPDGRTDVLAAVGRLRARGDEVMGFRVATAQELGRAPLARARFFDPERPREAVPADPAADPGFARRVDAWYDDLAAGFLAAGAEFEPLTTADPLGRALRAWVARR
ncbi:MAG: DUF58 domain-containing protein [Longimicrobiales bacterium]